MLVPLSWLEEFVTLGIDPGDRDALRALGETFDSLGLVVERIEQTGKGLDGVVVARVATIEAIEGADRIRRVLVDVGGADPVEVVCGAWNFNVGDLVPLATVGTELPNAMVIAKRKMKGVTSNGMLCSPAELGLSSEHAGILVLETEDGDASLGVPIATRLGIVRDAVFDLAIEPNRPDCLSIAGVARDLAAKLGLELRLPRPAPIESGGPVGEVAAIRIDAPEACPRLVARVIDDLGGLAALPSPPEVVRRLELCGMRPINAVVDATNYVMLELGQPTHAYDLDTLAGSGIAMRLAVAGERLVTLDGNERVLGEAGPSALGIEGGECVVTDLEGTVIGLAGVMGGEATEVRPSTRRVLLEVAGFSQSVVAGAARQHGLRSEASVRFERGVDVEGLERAADRVVELVQEAARVANVPLPVLATGTLDARQVPRSRLRIVLRTARLNALLGTELAIEEAAALLAPIGFSSSPVEGGLEVEVPSFRPDATLEVDVIEEVARHYGYQRIAARSRRSPSVGRLSRSQSELRLLRRLLVGFGVDEAWGSSIVDPTLAARLGGGARPVGLANPMVSEESVLRAHLLPGLLLALRNNVNRRQDDIRLFEIGNVFAARSTQLSSAAVAGSVETLVEERTQLGVLLADAHDDAATAVSCWWRLVEGLRLDEATIRLSQPHLDGAHLDGAHLDGARVDGAHLNGDSERGDRDESALTDDLVIGTHPSRVARLVCDANGAPPVVVGAVGEVDPTLLAAFGIDGTERRIGWLVCDVERLLTVARRSVLSQPISKFPSSDLDLAFVLEERLPAQQLRAVVEEAGGALVESVRVLDVYRGTGIEAGTRSVTLRVRLCALDHTLTDGEIATTRSSMVALASSRLGARLRGGA